MKNEGYVRNIRDIKKKKKTKKKKKQKKKKKHQNKTKTNNNKNKVLVPKCKGWLWKLIRVNHMYSSPLFNPIMSPHQLTYPF